MATIDMPSALSPRVLNALKADPRTVDLRGQAPHFYSLGARMLELFEEEDMLDVLTEVRIPCNQPLNRRIDLCNVLIDVLNRHLKSALPISRTTLTIREELWGMVSSFCGGWIRRKDSVSVLMDACNRAIGLPKELVAEYGALTSAVFRAAHDSAKATRTWMTDIKKT